MKIYRVDASQLQPKKTIVKIITLKQTVKVFTNRTIEPINSSTFVKIIVANNTYTQYPKTSVKTIRSI